MGKKGKKLNEKIYHPHRLPVGHCDGGWCRAEGEEPRLDAGHLAVGADEVLSGVELTARTA